MTQFNRKFGLVLVDKGGKGVDVSNLRCKFEITKTFTPTPNAAKLTVYNLNPDTANQIKKEFTRVIVQAGYQDNYGLIFDGNVRQAKAGREGDTDTFLVLDCGDGDKALNSAVVNKSLKAGATPGALVGAASEPLLAQGVKLGTNQAASMGAPLPRGKVVYGAAKDVLRQIAAANGAQWSIQDGALVFIGANSQPVGTAVLLSPQTGLVGVPEETDKGVSMKCLLNPNLRIYGPVVLSGTALAGNYKALSLKYSGDTRGNEFYADIVGKVW